MSTRTLKKQLTTLRHGHDKIAADPTWVAKNRALLLSQIKNTVKVDSSSQVFSVRAVQSFSHALKLFFPQNFVYTIRSMSFVSLALLLAVSGWIASVSAAQNSLPGEALYNVKLATEKTELIVASVVGGQKNKVDTLLKHASNRVDEFHKSKTTDQAKMAIQSLKHSIESTNESLQSIGTDAPSDASALAKSVNEKTDQLLDSLSSPLPVDSAPVVGTIADTADLQKEVGEATHLIEVTGVKAVQVLAEQTLAGDQTVSQQDVKASVEKKLDTLVTDFSVINKDAAAATTAVASSTVVENTLIISDVVTSSVSLSANSIVTATSSIAPDAVGLDNIVSPIVSAVSLQQPSTVGQAVKATEKTVAEVNKLVEKTVAEAKTLIQNNDLLGALKKVETLTDVKKDTGTVVNQVKIITESAAIGAALSSPPSSAVASTTVSQPQTQVSPNTTQSSGANQPNPANTAPKTQSIPTQQPSTPVSVQSIKIKSPILPIIPKP